MVQIGEAALLALVTIAAAWAGRCGGAVGHRLAGGHRRVVTLRSLANRADLSALTTRNFDSSTFAAWFTAYTLNSPRQEAVAVRRFRPAFRVAFNAWLATNPLHNPHAPPGPTYMPQYKLPAQARADALRQRSRRQVRRRSTTTGRSATTTSGSRSSSPQCCSW